MGQGAPQDDLHCVPTKQSVLFPLVNHTVLSVDAWGNALHVQMNPEWMEYGFYVEKNTYGLWSLSENRPVLSARYADILCCYPERNVYVVTDSRQHIQLRGEGDELLADMRMPRHVSHWCHPKATDPHLLLTRGVYDWKRRAFNLLTGKKVGPAFRHVGELREGLRYLHSSEDRYFMVDAEWNPVFELPYAPYDDDSLASEIPLYQHVMCRDGLIAVPRRDSCYLLDGNGNMLIPPQVYQHIVTVGAGRLLVSKGGAYALADREGTPLTDFSYYLGEHDVKPWSPHDDEHFSANRLALRKQLDAHTAKCGFLDANGKEVIPFVYDRAPWQFSRDFTVVGVETAG